MSDFRVLIIEDELHNSRILSGMVEKLRPNWELVGVLESVADSVEWLNNNEEADLILMDIQLLDGTCFSIFEQFDFESKTKIIFTTAYDQYAIRAFKVNSIDYLLKPIKEDELAVAFAKFEELQINPVSGVNPNDKAYYKSMIESIMSGKKEYRTRFLITGISGYTKLETKDIAYIYSSNKVTFAVDYNGKEYTLDYTLEHLEQDLDPEIFFRANRQMIVHIDTVKKVNNSVGSKLKVIMEPAPAFEVMVSRLKASDFKKWLGK